MMGGNFIKERVESAVIEIRPGTGEGKGGTNKRMTLLKHTLVKESEHANPTPKRRRGEVVRAESFGIS